MTQFDPTRRQILGGMAGAAALAGGGVGQARAASPVSLNIVDVAGNLALTRPAFEEFRQKNPGLVSRISFSQAPAPELPGKLKAQQNAGRVDIDMVLTGTDALSAGIEQKLWVDMFPDHAKDLPDLQKILQPAAWKMQSLAQGQAVVVSYYPSGPLLEYMPAKVKQVPTTADELLAWTRANKNRFIYARPANSGPGRTFLMGLPYILGDKDPHDPKDGWDKTWAYLIELGKNIEYYPSGTGAVMKELGEGSRDMTVTTTGWDINPRVLGVVPKAAEVGTIKGFHWVADAHYMAVPKGGPASHLPVVLKLMDFMLTKPAQAFAYDKGYFYPGPAVAGVPLSMAPKESQDVLKEYGRPQYEKWIGEFPIEVPLDAQKMVYAFDRWDQQVGSRAGK